MTGLRDCDARSAGRETGLEALLRGLPDWFGIERSIVEYVQAADELPTFVAEDGEALIGFVALKQTSDRGDGDPRHGGAAASGSARGRPPPRRGRRQAGPRRRVLAAAR